MSRTRRPIFCPFCVALYLLGFATGIWAQNHKESLVFFSQFWKQPPDSETTLSLDLYRDGILDERDLLQFIVNWQHRRHPDQEIVISLPGLPAGTIPLTLVLIPAGSFMMGSNESDEDCGTDECPQHQVNIGYSFYMGKYEVTKAQWQAVMGTTPWAGEDYVLSDPDSPAVNVSWNHTKAFITALNQLGQGTFRLPSEAEWEYACRAGTTTRFYWGDDPGYSQIGDYAWYRGNTLDIGNQYAHAVGQKLPNAFGLYDMSGNVMEWCEDDWHWDYSDMPTAGGAWVDSPRNDFRVLRGGSWIYPQWFCRSTYRDKNIYEGRYIGTGFRLASIP